MRRCKIRVSDGIKEWVCDKDFDILKSDNGFMVIGGYASTPTLDKSGEIIQLNGIRNDFNRFMQNTLYRNVSWKHSHIQVGTILDSYKDSAGHLWKTQVDDRGFFVVASIRNDIGMAREIQELIRNGKINSFSISGRAKNWNYVTRSDGMVKSINEIEIYEIAIADNPMNPEATFQVMKSKHGHNIRIHIDSIKQLPKGTRLGFDKDGGLYFEFRG